MIFSHPGFPVEAGVCPQGPCRDVQGACGVDRCNEVAIPTELF